MATVSQIDRIVKHHGRVITVRADVSVAKAARAMWDQEVGCLVVIGKERELIGIVTERDILGKVVAASVPPASVTVGEIMTSPIVSCRRDTPIAEAQRTMAGHELRHLPLVENGVAVGMVSSRDVMAQQLLETREALGRQTLILNRLERQYPGISRLDKDQVGRIVI